MNEPELGQLTLGVGGDDPDVASFRVSGQMSVERELPIAAEVRVLISGPDGEFVAEGKGHVATVQFRRHPATAHGRAWTERVHGVTLS